MWHIARYVLTVLGLTGFHSVVAQAQSYHSLTNPDHIGALDAGTVDFEAAGGSDGRTVP
jgi:hypothetical protein